MEALQQVMIKCFSKQAVDAENLLSNKYDLEKFDGIHRYENNLRAYKDEWDTLKAVEMVTDDKDNEMAKFFQWLDYGKGASLSLILCPRAQLQQQCVRYLKRSERKKLRVRVIGGLFVYKASGELVNTRRNTEMIYVVSPSEKIYIGEKEKGRFHHSSFLDGGDVLCAGHMEVFNGKLKALTANSGHYQPTKENFDLFKLLLQKKRVNLKEVEVINP